MIQEMLFRSAPRSASVMQRRFSKDARGPRWLVACRTCCGGNAKEGVAPLFEEGAAACSFGCLYCPAAGEGEAAAAGPQPRRSLPGAKTVCRDEPRCGSGRVPTGLPADPYSEAIYGQWTDPFLDACSRHRDGELTLVTRSQLVGEDLPRLTRISRDHSVTVLLSLATLDEKLLAVLEPGAPDARGRLSTMDRIRRAGIRTGLFVSPVLPALNDSLEELENLVRAAAKRGAAVVRAGFPALDERTRRRIWEAVSHDDPVLAERFRRLLNPGVCPPLNYARVVATRLKSLARKYGLEDPAVGFQGSASRCPGTASLREIFPERIDPRS